MNYFIQGEETISLLFTFFLLNVKQFYSQIILFNLNNPIVNQQKLKKKTQHPFCNSHHSFDCFIIKRLQLLFSVWLLLCINKFIKMFKKSSNSYFTKTLKEKIQNTFKKIKFKGHWPLFFVFKCFFFFLISYPICDSLQSHSFIRHTFTGWTM
jgi:hypothetical protein